jgi:hypothetical protein
LGLIQIKEVLDELFSIPTSTPSPVGEGWGEGKTIATNRSRKSAIGQPKTAKATSKPTTSTATKSASQEK